ncbi:MAG: glutaminase domain-containing protein [Candidatus Zipacnadales bacterium]
MARYEWTGTLFPGCLRAGSTVLGALFFSVSSFAEVPSVVYVELTGESQVWSETHPVYETTDDARFQRERYGSDFHVRLHGLPPGQYRVGVGLAEMKFTSPGERVFSITANGEVMLEAFDILKEVANYEALTKTFRIQLEEPILDLHFTAQRDNAKYCFIRVYNNEFVVEIGPDIPAAQAKTNDWPEEPYLTGMYETSIGKFGSRVAFNPRPRTRSWWQGALGHADYSVAYFEKDAKRWADTPYEMIFATELSSISPPNAPRLIYALPFTEALPSFPQVRQRITPTTLSYVCRAPDLPYEVEFTYVAPFYPQDLKLSTAPYIRLDVTIRDVRGQGVSGHLYVGQAVRPQEVVQVANSDELIGSIGNIVQFGKNTSQGWLAEAADDIRLLASEVDRLVAASPLTERELRVDSDGRYIVPAVQWQPFRGLVWDFVLPPGEELRKSFIYVGWCAEPVLRTLEHDLYFKYLEFFESPLQVAHYAFNERETIDRRRRLFEETVLGVRGLPPEFADLFSFAFQSWIMNTWYMSDQNGDWFSVWEGCCKFHSTVDVEYNVMPFYFQYWPELARLTLDEWALHEHNGIMPHDMGMGFEIGSMQYPHQMEVEEATNYVLLLLAYWRATDDVAPVKKHLALMDRLMDHVAKCDLDEDGFAEEGTSNTIDQGSRAVQHAPKQVYLAVKSLAAWQALGVMAEAVGEAKIARKHMERARLVAATLRDKAWLNDHYVVALKPESRETPLADGYAGFEQDYGEAYGSLMEPYMGGGRNGGTPPGYGAPYTPEPVPGWDGYSIYAANGLVYAFAYGLPVEVDFALMRADMLAATAKTLKRFGSPHTDRESNTWISQNLWRDMAAAYLGLDMLDHVALYWAFEIQQNRNARGCFTDVYNYGSGSTSLDYYPRGLAVAGLVPAAAGLRIDRVQGDVIVAPVRAPLRIPLTVFADWEQERVPWLEVLAGEGGLLATLDAPELLGGLRLRMVSPSAQS